MFLYQQKQKGKHTRAIILFSFSDFDLEKEKSVLDEQGLRIAENQENSQKNRRKLAESTRSMHILSLLFPNLLLFPNFRYLI